MGASNFCPIPSGQGVAAISLNVFSGVFVVDYSITYKKGLCFYRMQIHVYSILRLNWITEKLDNKSGETHSSHILILKKWNWHPEQQVVFFSFHLTDSELSPQLFIKQQISSLTTGHCVIHNHGVTSLPLQHYEMCFCAFPVVKWDAF